MEEVTRRKISKTFIH